MGKKSIVFTDKSTSYVDIADFVELHTTKTTDCSTCKKRVGYLHDANFTNKTVTVGDNTTIAEDNFRNDSWGIISETNCGTGRIPKGSTVNVLSTTPVTREGTSLKYYKVEYDECLETNDEKTICGGDPCKTSKEDLKKYLQQQ